MVKRVDYGRRDDWYWCFTDSGWWFVCRHDVHINVGRRIRNVWWRISIKISLFDATVLYCDSASGHNLRKTETNSPLELAFNRKRIDRKATVHGHRDAMNLRPPVNEENFSSARARSVVILTARISDRMPRRPDGCASRSFQQAR